MKKTFILPAVLTALAFSLTGCAQPAMPDTIKVESAEKDVISVNSNEEVKVVPDMAEIVFGVYSQGKDAAECQSQNNEQVDKVLQVLEDFGIDEKSIQTSGYDLNPIYDWESGQTITGYEMSTDITVTDITLEQVGTLISECVDAGINNIKSVSYLSSKYDESYQEALKKAIESARTKAQAIAEAGNCTLGGIVKVEEYSSNQEARYTGYQRSANKEEAGAGSTYDMAAVKPGQVSVEARILVEFEIKN